MVFAGGVAQGGRDDAAWQATIDKLEVTGTEVDLAARARVTRMTVRKALGKAPGR